MRLLVAACFLLTACAADEPPPMSVADARAQLSRVARNGNAEAFCSPEGRAEFRQAVRALSIAHEAAGEEPADIMSGNDPVWGLVLIGVMARIVEPGDLRGEMRGLAAQFRFADVAVQEFGNGRAALQNACPELISFYRAAAQVQQLQTQLARVDDPDSGLARGLMRRLTSASADAERAMRRLETKMRESGVDL